MTMTTARLRSTDPYPSALRLATQPPFLRAAGQGRVPKHILAQYLSQDRLYQHAYIRMVGSLLGKLQFEDTTLARRTMNALIDALHGIRKELEFFEDVARRYGFSLETPTPPWSSSPGPTPITRAYTDFFTAVSSPSASLLE